MFTFGSSFGFQGGSGGGSGGATQFIQLTDCPSSYSGQALKYVRVKADETGLEFSDVSLIYFSESQTKTTPNDSIYANRFMAVGSSDDIDAVFSPKGTGAFLLQVPDGTIIGGNKRGVYSADLQTIRDNADQVASGAKSFTVNSHNKAIGESSFASGYQTTAGVKMFNVSSVVGGLVTISGYGDLTPEFNGSTFVILDGTYFQYVVGSLAYSDPNFTLQLVDTTINTGTHVVSSVNLNSYLADVNIGYMAHSEGQGTQAFGDYSHSEGDATMAYAMASHSEGQYTQALGTASHAEGTQTRATKYGSHAEGFATIASGEASHSEGKETVASGDWSHAEGGSSTSGLQTRATASYAHAEGDATTASGVASHSEGGRTTASSSTAHAEGYLTTASGTSSHSEGDRTTASGVFAHSEGGSTTASGSASHSEGYYTTADGNYSHSEGRDTNSTGLYSHAEGFDTNALGTYSHSEGYKTNANADYSHAEGRETTVVAVSGNYGHAEGYLTTVSGLSGHSEGSLNTSSGNYSHSEGRNSTASGDTSHASGRLTLASGVYSRTENTQNTADSYCGSSMGQNASTHGIKMKRVVGGGFFEVASIGTQGGSGVAQKGSLVLKQNTTNAVTQIMVAGEASTEAVTAQSQAVIQNNSVHRYKGTITAKETGTTNVAVYDFDGVIVRGVNALTTTLSINNKTTIVDTIIVGGITISADTTLGCLKIQVTGKALTNIAWVCTLETTEVIYA